MNSINQIGDIDLKLEIASRLGWYDIQRNAQGIPTGKLSGVRSFVPLVIPDWTADPVYVHGLESTLRVRGLWKEYVGNLLNIYYPDGADVEEESDLVLAEADPRRRCEAALITLREIENRS